MHPGTNSSSAAVNYATALFYVPVIIPIGSPLAKMCSCMNQAEYSLQSWSLLHNTLLHADMCYQPAHASLRAQCRILALLLDR